MTKLYDDAEVTQRRVYMPDRLWQLLEERAAEQRRTPTQQLAWELEQALTHGATS